MKHKKAIFIIALIDLLATVSVAADETGIFTINIFNTPNSQITADISNSTIQGQTNYTNSNAIENITLTNSTLTLNVNGQNITTSSQGDDLSVTAPNQSSSPNPTVTPTLLSVTFLSVGGEDTAIFFGKYHIYRIQL